MPRRLRLLDLFCGAGGAAMGYHLAGFTEIVGIDIKPQPRYPFTFIQGDATNPPVDLSRFDAIHASPPCQGFSDLRWMYNAKRHPNLIPKTRRLLKASGKPFVIENVKGAPLKSPLTLCGTMFDMGSGDAELWRHRIFESPVLMHQPHCMHRRRPRVIGVYGGHGRDRRRKVNTQDYSTEQRREAMRIDWMTGNELSQAIPPAYTEFIGRALIAAALSLTPGP